MKKIQNMGLFIVDNTAGSCFIISNYCFLSQLKWVLFHFVNKVNSVVVICLMVLSRLIFCRDVSDFIQDDFFKFYKLRYKLQTRKFIAFYVPYIHGLTFCKQTIILHQNFFRGWRWLFSILKFYISLKFNFVKMTHMQHHVTLREAQTGTE